MNAPSKKSLIKNLLLKSSPIFFILLVFAACNTNQLTYYKYQPVNVTGWLRSDTLLFEITNLEDGNLPISVTTEIRYTTDYPYRNISLCVMHNLEDSLTWRKDTLHYTLIDREGRHSTNNWSCLYEANETLPNLNIIQPGETSYIKVYQIMEKDTLAGVHDIGIKISH